MNGKPAWWRWFSTSLGVNTAIVLFNAILIGILWNAVFGLVQIERQDTIRTAIDRNDNLAIAFEQYTIRTIGNADALIQHLIQEYAYYGGKIDLTKWAADHTIDNKTIVDVVLADEHGNALITAYSHDQAKQINVADREHFRVHIERDSGRLFVGKPVVGRVTGQWVIPITRRIDKADGTFGGVAMALIEPARFTDVLQDARLRPLDIISLVGLDGITRARLKGTTASWGEDISKSPLLAERARHPNGNYFAIGQLDHVPRYFSYRSLPNYQVMAIVGAAEADVLAKFYRRQTQYFWAAGLTSVFIAGFAVLLMLALAGQRRAAAAVVRSHSRILATFAQAAVGIAHTDLEGRYLEVNQQLCDILGYSREELLKRRFNDVIHPDDVHSIADSRRQLLAKPGEVTALEREKSYIRRDGAIIWCNVTLSVVRDNTGRVEYVLAMIQDITDRKRAEEKLRESQARFRILTEMSSDFYWESDAEHRLTARASANRKVSMVSAFEREAQIGERRWEIPNLSPDEAGWQAHRAALDAHLPFREFELSRLGADGAERHISISGDPVFDASGTFKGYRGVGSDITERTQALEATRQLTERLTTTLESITDAFFTLDREWRFTYVNREAERLLGRPRGELTGRDLWTEFPDTIGSTFEREYRRAMADNKTVGFEEFYPPLNTWFSVRAYPSDQGLAVYFHDVTETKRTAEEIKFKNTILQTQQETSLDAILVVDENEQIISYNQQFVDLWRLSPQLVSARVDGPVLQSVVDQVGNSEAFLHRVQYLYEHRDDKSREEILLKDGRTIDRYSAPVVGANRKYYGRVWYFRDITEGKHTEERLQKLSNAIEHSPAATVITDPHGRIEYVNPKFREITGYAPEELIGKTTALIKSGLTLPDVYEDLWRTILSGREWRGEMQNRRKNGELYWEYEIISALKNERGEIINFVAVKEDITERKQAAEALQKEYAMRLEAERELLRAQESLADAAHMEAVGRLAAGVAHEVKNPLTVVRLGVDYLAKQLSGQSNPEIIDDIRAAIDRADEVIRDMLDFSRQRPFTRRPTDINQVIDHALELVKHEIEFRSLAIVRTRNDPLPPIYADPERLVQVFINVFANAAQAIGRDGRIEITTRAMRVSNRDLAQPGTVVFRIGEPVIEVEILDSGPGIPAEAEKKLFQPFFTTKPEGEGSGLGLAVSRNIVIMHRGAISISNRPEGGAAARLMFRVEKGALDR